MNELTTIERPLDAYRMSTDAAGACGEIVKRTAKPIQGRRYVSVEGWQAIAIAHGCAASSDHVERVTDEGMSGFKAIGFIRRMSDGAEIARAEGFLGDDEGTWAKRTVHARRAMVQTRAISRACRSAFAHVVVMIDSGLSTTPAEEMPAEGDLPPHNPQTGEIIEGERIPTKEPAAREVLDGPHTSKTALRKAIIDIRGKVQKATTLDEIEALKEEHKRTINQARRDWPALIDGDPNIPEDIGLKGTIALRRAELTPTELSETGQMCMETLEAVTSKQELDGWFKLNWKYVEELDGAERDKVETRYEELERSFKQLETVTAGG